MYGNKLVFWWCCALLFVASSSKYHQNFTNNNERRDNKIQKNLTSNKFSDTVSYEDSNFVPQEMCTIYDICETFCCHFEAFSNPTECMPGEKELLNAYKDMHYSLQRKNQDMNLTVYFLIYDPYQKIKQFELTQDEDIKKNVFIVNGTDYFPYQRKFVESKFFCPMDVNKDMLRLECDIATFNTSFPMENVSKILIYEILDPNNPFKSVKNYYISIRISMCIICILPLLAIFLVYSILPELHDKHGFILRNCIGVIIVAYIFESAKNLKDITIKPRYLNNVTMDSICYFGFLATYFWSTVMSFDMWWTFRDISLANMSHRQQERESNMKEREKLIMYSFYAWGSSFILTIFCVIRNSVPPVMFSSLRPEFGIIISWFTEYMEAGLYYCIPSIICSVSSICLFISTALKIRRYEKNTTHYLRNVDSRVYDENKKWFNLCQKWFIMMFIVIGISVFIGIVWLIFPYTLNVWHILYIAHSTDMVQNIGIFITFVCNKRIKKLLLKRFGCQNYNVPPTARQTEVDDTVSNRNNLLDETSF